jgi:hypothetical protein
VKGRVAAILAAVGMLIGACETVCASDRQVVADVRCVVVGLRMVQMAPQQRTAALMLAAYYLGRLDSRVSDSEVEELIEQEAEKMSAAEFRAGATRCGKALTIKGEEIREVGAYLSRKAQQGGAPRK